MTLGEGEVFDDVIGGYADVGCTGFRAGISQEAEVYVVAGTEAGLAVSLADVAVAQVVDERWRDRPGIAEDHALRVVNEDGGGRLSGKLLGAGEGVFLEAAPPEDVVLAGGRPVEPGDAGVQRLRRGRGKRVGPGIELIAEIDAVGGWFRVEVAERVGIGSRPGAVGRGSADLATGVDLRDLGGRQGDDRAVADVLQYALLVEGRRHGLGDD